MPRNVFEKEGRVWLTDHLADSMECGRGNLGGEMPVFVYRLFQFTLRDLLVDEEGEERAAELYRKAGFRAGEYLAEHMLELDRPIGTFVARLQSLLVELKIGVMRIEEFDDATGRMVITVAEDLDCSGLPMLGMTVCTYDEGFLAGILSRYTKKTYEVREIDCWASGGRVCRFEAKVSKVRGAP